MKHTRPAAALSPADRLTLQAAEGWLEFTNPAEALTELGRVTWRGRSSLDVLLLRWRILARMGDWKRGLSVARSLARRYPDDVRSWIHLGEALYQLKQFEEAYRIASAKVADFPDSAALLEDAACYACLIAKFAEAEKLFADARKAGRAPLSETGHGGSAARGNAAHPLSRLNARNGRSPRIQ